MRYNFLFLYIIMTPFSFRPLSHSVHRCFRLRRPRTPPKFKEAQQLEARRCGFVVRASCERVEGAGSFVPTATRSTNSLAAFWLFSSFLPSRVLHAFWEDGGVSREGPGLVCRSHLPPKRDWRMEERVRVCRCASASMPVLALSRAPHPPLSGHEASPR